MWASIEAARKAANGTHIANRIDSLRHDEDSDGKLRVDLMVDSPKTVGMVALPSDISVGVTPDQGKQILDEATAVAEMTESVSPRLHAILDGMPEGIIQSHELPGIGSIGDPSRGDLMAGSTKAPFYGAAYKKRGLAKGIAPMSRASTQPRVEYVCGLLQSSVTDIARSMVQFNSQEIACSKFERLMAAMADQNAQQEKNLTQIREAQTQSQQAQTQLMQMMAGASKGDDSKFERLMAAMAEQNAQIEKNLAQIREAQTQSQQAQTQLMQMMAMIYAGQKQQRLTNAWVVKSVEAISTNSGCAIETSLASHEMKSLYGNLFGNANPTKAQMMDGGARERTPSEVEADAQRFEEQLLAPAPSTQDF